MAALFSLLTVRKWAPPPADAQRQALSGGCVALASHRKSNSAYRSHHRDMVVPRWQLSSLNTRSSPFTCISSGAGDASLKACCRTGAVGSAAHPCAATRYHAVINLDRPAACGRGDSGDLDLLGCRCARRSLPSRIRRAVAHRQCGADAGSKGHLVRDSQLEAAGALPLLADARLPFPACPSAGLAADSAIMSRSQSSFSCVASG